MSRHRRRHEKKGMHPAFAVLMLLGSAAFVARTLWPSLGEEAGSGLADLIGLGESPDMGPDVAGETAGIEWCDLLAVHGSFDRTAPVRLAFRSPPDAQFFAAAPAGETAPSRAAWTGDDPPLLVLGVVMVSADSKRAVLGGQVVGIGDSVADARVLGIAPGTVRMRWRDRQLTYDLDSEAPREFRAEYLRRKAGDQGEDEATAGNLQEEKR